MTNRETPFELSEQEKRSFQGKRCSFVTLNGPLRLMRLVGPETKCRADGRYWFDEDLFWTIVDSITAHHDDHVLVNRLVRRILRDDLAVCHNWNTFASVYEMRIPASQQVQAYAGHTAPHDYYSAIDSRGRRSFPRMKLHGGGFQYIIHVDAKTRELVRGPIPHWISRSGRA
jgi:hypothetical protein